MNKSKRYIAFVLSITFIVGCLVGCTGSKKNEFKQLPTESASEATVPTETLPAIKPSEEIVSFTSEDKDSNEITCSPIYDADGESVIAGYILSVKDKNGKDLTAKEFPLLNSIVKALPKDKSAEISFDQDGKLVSIESFANEKGDIIAIKDVLDLDGDKNVNEYLRVTKKADGNGLTKVMVEYINVQVKKEKGQIVVIDGDKKVVVKTVDSENKEVAKKEEQEVKKNEIAKKDAKTSTSTTKKNTESTTKKKTDNKDDNKESTTNSTTALEKTDIDIVLLKNSKAECKSSNVDIENAKVTIHEEGDYLITSQTDDWHGKIVVKLPNTAECSIRFEDVKISYDQGNIIQIQDTSIDTDRTFIETEAVSSDDVVDNELLSISENDHAPNVSLSFPEGTRSEFISSANSYTGVLYNESKLTIKGNGSVKFESIRNRDNCICSTKSITIKNCAVSLITANNMSTEKPAGNGSGKGIFSYNKVTVDSGSLTAKVNGDGIRCSRFICNGGTVDVKSSACDAFDTDNEITINGGSVTAYATEKSVFKVRRVNAGKQKEGKNHTFDINGGTVFGAGKKSTPVQSSSTQASLNASIRSTDPQKTYGTRGVISIKNNGTEIASSSVSVTTLIYSSGSVSKTKAYKMTANSHSADFAFNGKVGTASFAG